MYDLVRAKTITEFEWMCAMSLLNSKPYKISLKSQ